MTSPEDDSSAAHGVYEVLDWTEYDRRSRLQSVGNALLFAAAILFAPGVLMGYTSIWQTILGFLALIPLAGSVWLAWKYKLTLSAVTRSEDVTNHVDDIIRALDEAKALIGDLQLAARSESQEMQRLRAQASVQRQLASLSGPAANAVTDKWVSLLKAERGPNLRFNALVGVVSFVCGVLWSTFGP